MHRFLAIPYEVWTAAHFFSSILLQAVKSKILSITDKGVEKEKMQ